MVLVQCWYWYSAFHTEVDTTQRLFTSGMGFFGPIAGP